MLVLSLLETVKSPASSYPCSVGTRALSQIQQLGINIQYITKCDSDARNVPKSHYMNMTNHCSLRWSGQTYHVRKNVLQYDQPHSPAILDLLPSFDNVCLTKQRWPSNQFSNMIGFHSTPYQSVPFYFNQEYMITHATPYFPKILSPPLHDNVN